MPKWGFSDSLSLNSHSLLWEAEYYILGQVERGVSVDQSMKSTFSADKWGLPILTIKKARLMPRSFFERWIALFQGHSSLRETLSGAAS